jgi:hypothetical protein
MSWVKIHFVKIYAILLKKCYQNQILELNIQYCNKNISSIFYYIRVIIKFMAVDHHTSIIITESC